MIFSALKKLFPLVAALFFLRSLCIPAIAQQNPSTSLPQKLATLETAAHGRIGVCAIDTSNNKCLQYRAQEHFPFCSTFKVMDVAAILKQSMTDNNLLQQKIIYTEKEVEASGYAPITKNYLSTGMTINDLCVAAIAYSDNNAANLLMKKLGGPQAVTAFARSIGDLTFRLERWEPELNSGIPDDLRDTSTPAAMENSLQKLTLGTALGLPQQNQLITWMKKNTTGDTRIRAGVPTGWIVADKTGSGDYGITNDIGIIWPPNAAPIVVVIYFIQDQKEAARRDDVIASATKILLDEFDAMRK